MKVMHRAVPRADGERDTEPSDTLAGVGLMLSDAVRILLTLS